ncbi:MAG: hypothetical protein OXG44_04330 [Gammaproteobacteria bacterium]|nr:hypothetical protein [Gammaproteobacteria bacterium]
MTDRKIGIVYKADSRGPRAWLSRLMHRSPLGNLLRLLYTIRLAQHAEDSPRERSIPTICTPATREDVTGLSIRGPSRTVGDFLPVGFDAYAWLPNPIWIAVPPGTGGAIAGEEPAGDGGCWWKPINWSEIAAANGVTMTKHTGLHEIGEPREQQAGGRAGAVRDRDWYPREGTLEPFVAKELFSILGRETKAVDTCLVGQWEGGSNWYTDVKLMTPNWNYFIWRTRFTELADWLRQPDSFERSVDCPHIIWPADRKWCVATLYSGYSNYVAGSRALIDAILASGVEAFETELTSKAT